MTKDDLERIAMLLWSISISMEDTMVNLGAVNAQEHIDVIKAALLAVKAELNDITLSF